MFHFFAVFSLLSIVCTSFPGLGFRWTLERVWNYHHCPVFHPLPFTGPENWQDSMPPRASRIQGTLPVLRQPQPGRLRQQRLPQASKVKSWVPDKYAEVRSQIWLLQSGVSHSDVLATTKYGRFRNSIFLGSCASGTDRTSCFIICLGGRDKQFCWVSNGRP